MIDTESLSPLIGRQEEQELFLRLLNAAASDRVSLLVIWGQGGIGKTKLLEHLASLAEERQVMHSGIIDLYLTTNQRVAYLVDNLVMALGQDWFTDFLQAKDEYYRKKELTTDQVELEPLHSRMQAENYRAFNRLSQNQRVVLFFDTFEIVQDRVAGEFLLHELLPHLHNYLIVISGRRRIETEVPNVERHSLELTPFGVRDAYDYLNSCGLEVSEKEAEDIWLLSGGRPILLSLTIDWLRETTDISHLARITPEDYEESLVRGIRSLARPEHETILFMAHAFHRFDASLLAYLSGRDHTECEATLSRLSRLSFIKYKPSMKSCMLHDEMRDLVINHVWDPLDMSRQTRRRLSEKIIPYYTVLIENCPEFNQRMVYVTEQMYHRVYASPDEGITSFLGVFDSTLRKNRLGYCDMLIREVKSLSYLLNESQKALVELSRCQLLDRLGDRTQAKQIAGRLARSPDVDASVKAVINAWLRELTLNDGDLLAGDSIELQ